MTSFQKRLWHELVRDHAAALARPARARDPLAAVSIVESHGQAPDARLALRVRPTPVRPTPRVRSSLRSSRFLSNPARLAATAAALIAIAAATVIFTTTGTTPSAAYAVTQNPDGTITVSIAELTGITGANEQLALLGVRVKVVPVRAGCTASGQIVLTPPPLFARIAHVQGQGVAIRPDLIPAGETLVLTARQAGVAVDLSSGLYRGPVPDCIGVG